MPWEWGWLVRGIALFARGRRCSTWWSRCCIAGCPAATCRGREILPGAAVTVVLWVALASLFSLYLQNLGRFSLTYGSLGGIVITLMFFYVSALIFIFGAEINSARRRAEAARLRAERAAERRGARWLIRATAARMRRGPRFPQQEFADVRTPCP